MGMGAGVSESGSRWSSGLEGVLEGRPFESDCSISSCSSTTEGGNGEGVTGVFLEIRFEGGGWKAMLVDWRRTLANWGAEINSREIGALKRSRGMRACKRV